MQIHYKDSEIQSRMYIEQAYNNWILDRFKENEETIGNNCKYVFLTITPHETNNQNFHRSIFDAVYLRLCDSIIGNNYNRKHHLQPFGVAALDVAGTRQYSIGASQSLVMPHIHSVLALHPSTVNRFESLKSEMEEVPRRDGSSLYRWEISDSRVATADFIPIREGTLDKVISYSMKFTTMCPDHGQDDFWFIPRSRQVPSLEGGLSPAAVLVA